MNKQMDRQWMFILVNGCMGHEDMDNGMGYGQEGELQEKYGFCNQRDLDLK